jgi:4-azaleucine resistance transporter AzlC
MYKWMVSNAEVGGGVEGQRGEAGRPVIGQGSRAGLLQGARAALPFALAGFAFGASFGVLARTGGLGSVVPTVMSATTWAGSAQFAALTVLVGGGGFASAVLAGTLLNARYFAMSAALAPYLSGGRLARALTALAVVDESWALAARAEGGFDRRRLLGAAAVLYPGWVVGTALGSLLGGLVGDPRRLGLDAAFPALYLAILRPRLTDSRHRVVAALGAAIALLTLPVTPAGLPICLACVAALWGLRR